MNQNINTFRVGLKGKKWYLYLAPGCQSLECLAYRTDGTSRDSTKSFRREVAMTFLNSFQDKPKARDRKPMKLPGADSARFDYSRGAIWLCLLPRTSDVVAWVKTAPHW